MWGSTSGTVHNNYVVLTPPSALEFSRKNSFLLREDHEVQVNTLYISRNGRSVLGAD